VTDIPGFKARTTQRGYRLIELDAWADPARGSEWMAAARKRSASIADFEREVNRNWAITSGSTFFPEFGEVGREQYLYEPQELLRGPVIRGWDFGWRAPVCVWLQYALKSDRVYVLREFAPRGISAHHFRDVSRYLSGQLTPDMLDGPAMEWIEMLRGLPGVPKPPWFPPGIPFVDLSGPEVNATQSISARDPHEATLRQVWAAGGIEFAIQSGPVKARATVLRRLLSVRRDGRPGILVSPVCLDVLAMLDGGLTFRRATVANPKPEEPKKDGRHDNAFDALTYALVGIVPPEGVPGVTPGMEPWPAEESIGWTL
jgi:hypothetical protein